MADQIITKQELIDAQKDALSLEQFVNGSADLDVLTRLSEKYPTLKKFLLEMQKYNSKAYSTLAAATADLANIPAGVLVTVTNDAGNNGWYSKQGNALVKSPFDPLTQAKDYTDQTSTDFISKEKAQDEEILVAITDVNGQRTWLESEKTGSPTTRSTNLISKSLEDAKTVLMRKEINEELLFAILDLFGVPTSLSVRKDGSFSDIAIRDIQSRINASNRAFSDTNKMSVWGSSTIDYSHYAWQEIATQLGISNIWLGGKGGEVVETICARQGSVPALVKFNSGKINAAGSNQEVLISNMPIGANNLKSYDAKINGATGTISYSSSSSTGFYFTRTDSGGEITVSSAKDFLAIPVAGDSYQNSICIINIGKNNLTNSDSRYNSAQYVLEYTKKAVEYVKPFYKFVLVIDHFVDTNSPADIKSRVESCNALLKTYFGERCVNLNAYLLSEKVWIDTNITPTAADLQNQANGYKPSSLSRDDWHMNPAAEQAFIKNIVKPILISYGWYNNIGA